MRNNRCLVLMSILLFAGAGVRAPLYAQEKMPAQESCPTLTAEEILFEIKTVYGLIPNPEKVLVAGEVRTPLSLPLSDTPLTLSSAVAMLGGFSKISSNTVFLIRRPANEEKSKTLREINFNEIRRGLRKDLHLEKGDVVFAPGICKNGKRAQNPFVRKQGYPSPTVDPPMPGKKKSRDS